MQAAPEFERIRKGVASLSALTYCQPVNSAINVQSILGKRGSGEITPSSEQTEASLNPLLTNGVSRDSNLIKFANGVTQVNSIATAWSLHQGGFGEDGNFHGNTEDELVEEMNNVPLHVACGYVDDVFGFFENNAMLNGQPNAAALYLPEIESLGVWPFTGEFHQMGENMMSAENSKEN